MPNLGDCTYETGTFKLKEVLIPKPGTEASSITIREGKVSLRVWDVPPELVPESEFRACFVYIGSGRYQLDKLELKNCPYGGFLPDFRPICIDGMKAPVVKTGEEMKDALQTLKLRLESTTSFYLKGRPLENHIVAFVTDPNAWAQLPLPEWESE